ncbi:MULTISPECIES: GbsR/MarR family transcriptional regulator [unclassified Nocardioides]|uniref:GbsR/MarR family transcriptional regulator n=1 Tax=unclassified Nocardioides TaxID=2615069 RepID=UPI000702DE20|nr:MULTISPECIES: MarR family transcriptional regulator [unclassified Nocardioides]KQZ70747.1 hypothetical protein ASD66_14335 [Nocardioides sp. Root151]KRF10905.1 hypothetical protein ASH02_18870 [Nocardioides sp. Soil796]
MADAPDPASDTHPRQFVEDLASMLSGMGFPRMPSRVFAALLGAPGAGMTSRELAESLQVSPAAISGAVNYLLRVHLVRRRRDPGERADRFSTEADLWADAMMLEIKAYDALVKLMDTALSSGDLSPDAETRITDTRDFFVFIGNELPSLYARWQDEQKSR